MKVLLLGSGGREHALAWKISASPSCTELYIAPGNPGTAQCGQNVSLSPLDFEAVATFCVSKQIDLVLIGPEEPLVKGITDFLRWDPALANLIICGPDAAGACLEGSKAFAKAFMSEFDIPTARYGEFNRDQETEAIQFLDSFTPPYVIKADGLAAGKGVLICAQKEEAAAAISGMFAGEFGEAGHTIVLEEFLDGIEFSVFALTDGKHACLLPIAKDYKRIGDGDTGPNTGGMGAVSPVPFVDESLLEKVRTRIVTPTVQGLVARGIVYQGFLFIGLILVKGEPYVIEYNCRMGDPETEVVMPRLKTDLLELMVAMHEQRLDKMQIEMDPRTAMTVMLVSGGYPGSYKKGMTIEGSTIETPLDTMVFHAGTRMDERRLVTNGGRVLACTAYGQNLEHARRSAYELVKKISFDQMNYRNDIGSDL
ncbi:MAG: phosphoribosylamine--glycine ligase [Saprospiraceae bacterium]|nr:phosphoribosylamine--glycine ligase [Saprospiraceae bacterium]